MARKVRNIGMGIAIAALFAAIPAPAAFAAPDYDGDGVTDGDCQPLDPGVHPGAVDAPDVGFEDLNCDGIDGDPTKAFFVSLTGNDDGTGSRAIPFRTINKGIAAATADPVRKSVYIVAGTYDTEQVALADGVSLYGGYLPDGTRSNDEKTVITRSNTLGVVLADGDVGVELQLLTVNGPNFGSGGSSSYAIRAIGGSSLVLTKVFATGGSAGAGTAGGPGTPGSIGEAGQCGGITSGCNESVGDGGAGGIFGPGGGGNGGDGANSPATAGAGVNGDTGQTIGGSPGGGGGSSPSDDGNDAIVPGANGAPGAVAAFSKDNAGATWTTGTTASSGVLAGSGGGGGGGSSGTTTTRSCFFGGSATVRGGGGGGGGEGGAGGGGGSAGSNGGGSFGVYLHQSTVVVDGGQLSGGAGGNGGNGGAGGDPGPGLPGGPGGAPDFNPVCTGGSAPGPGGDGGRGADGGRGGGGGGGAGGPSAGLFAAGTSNFVLKTNAQVSNGTPGQGGLQGGTAVRGGSGQAAGTIDDSDPNAAVADFDGDGRSDSDDACPAVAAGATDANADGCPDRAAKLTDGDGDGIPDGADACPAQAAGTADANGDGCPDPPPPPPPPPAAVDNDRDGIPVPFDCNDGDANVRPGIAEVAGNVVDENCDGIATPFPRLDVGIGNSFAFTKRSTTVKVLEVRRAPAGAKIKVTCKTPKRKKGCAFKTKSLTSRGRTVKLVRYFKKRRLPVGTVIEVTTTTPNTIGKVVRYTTRKSKAPRTQTLCLLPGAKSATRCV